MTLFRSIAGALLSSSLVFTGVGALASLTPAHAYELYMTKDGKSPLRWWQRDVLEFHLATVPPEETDLTAIQAIAERAFDQWIDAPCGLVPEVTSGGMVDVTKATTPTSLRAEPDNVFVFIKSSSEWTGSGNSPTWIAITKIAHDPSTGEIVDADIEINDGGYAFSYDDTPGVNEVDFLAMLTHELGHFFGLDHSDESSATMFATYATSPAAALDARTLSQDDIAGVCALYTDVPVHKVPGTGGGDEGCSASGGAAALWGVGLLLLVLTWRRRALPHRA